MDFIKIPYFKKDGMIGDAAIRISNIHGIFCLPEKNDSIIYFNNDGSITTPMSVAKIYDLIWQTELSNQFREPMKSTVKEITDKPYE